MDAWWWFAASISSFTASLIVKESGKIHTVLSHIHRPKVRRCFIRAQPSSSLSLTLTLAHALSHNGQTEKWFDRTWGIRMMERLEVDGDGERALFNLWWTFAVKYKDRKSRGRRVQMGRGGTSAYPLGCEWHYYRCSSRASSTLTHTQSPPGRWFWWLRPRLVASKATE